MLLYHRLSLYIIAYRRKNHSAACNFFVSHFIREYKFEYKRYIFLVISLAFIFIGLFEYRIFIFPLQGTMAIWCLFLEFLKDHCLRQLQRSIFAVIFLVKYKQSFWSIKLIYDRELVDQYFCLCCLQWKLRKYFYSRKLSYLSQQLLRILYTVLPHRFWK